MFIITLPCRGLEEETIWHKSGETTTGARSGKRSTSTSSFCNVECNDIYVHVKREGYLLARSAATPTLDEFYSREIFWKLRFRSFLRKKQHENHLVNDLRAKFGNAVLIFGDATIGNNKFHPPTPCLGIRDLLQRKGFDILV